LVDVELGKELMGGQAFHVSVGVEFLLLPCGFFYSHQGRYEKVDMEVAGA
jgi:hypothetical protein